MDRCYHPVLRRAHGVCEKAEMAEMAEMEEFQSREVSRISRRTALKVGVAAGVGVAAWGGPQIGRIGSQPAYAEHCTPGTFTTTEESSNKKNTNWNDKCKPGMEYQQDINFVFANGVEFHNDPVCSIDQDNGPSTYTAGPVPAGDICVPVVTVFDVSSGTSLEVEGTPISGGTTSNGLMPSITQQYFFDNAEPQGVYSDPSEVGGSMFFSVKLKCGPEACFHV